jgi:hypothetical protein
VANESGIDNGAMKRAVQTLRELVPDDLLGQFEKLNEHELNAGPDSFDAARWLEELLVDRRHGMIEGAKFVKVVVDGLADALEKVMNIFEQTDEEGALSIEDQRLTELNGWIDRALGADIPPAAPGNHYLFGRTDYNSGDTGELPSYLGWDIHPDGYGGDPDGVVHINTDRREQLPVPSLLDDYRNIIDEANPLPGKDIDEDFIFSDGPQIVDRDDPVYGGTDPEDGETDPEDGETDPEDGETDPEDEGGDPPPGRQHYYDPNKGGWVSREPDA